MPVEHTEPFLAQRSTSYGTRSLNWHTGLPPGRETLPVEGVGGKVSQANRSRNPSPRDGGEGTFEGSGRPILAIPSW